MEISFFLSFFLCFSEQRILESHSLFLNQFLLKGCVRKLPQRRLCLGHDITLPEVVDNLPNLLTLMLNWLQLEAK